MNARRRSRLLANLALVLVALLIALVIAENTLRVYESRLSDTGLEFDDDGIDLAANNFNDSWISFAKAADEFRVLSFGDSFAYGIVHYRYSYHAVAANYLNDRVGGDGVWVRFVNLGEPAISFPEYTRNQQYWAEILEHDTSLFLVFVGNDFLRVRRRTEEQVNRFANLDFDMQTGERRIGRIPVTGPLRLVDYFRAVWGSLNSRVPAGVVDRRYNRAVLELGRGRLEEIAREHLVNYDTERLEELRDGYLAAAAFLEALDEHGYSKPPVVILAPELLQIDLELQQRLPGQGGEQVPALDWDLPRKVFGQIRDRLAPGVAVLDLAPVLRCAARQGMEVHFGTDTHWSAEANALVGEAVGRDLSARWFGVIPAAVQDCAALLVESADTEPAPMEVAAFLDAQGIR